MFYKKKKSVLCVDKTPLLLQFIYSLAYFIIIQKPLILGIIVHVQSLKMLNMFKVNTLFL